MSTRWGSKRASMHCSVHQIFKFQGGLIAARPSQLPRCSWRSWVRSITLLVTFGLTPGLVATAGDMYRWSDNNGNPVISDRPPPPGVPYTLIDADRYGAKANAVSSVANSDKVGAKNSEPMDTDAMNEVGVTSNTTPKVEKRPELCAQAKDNIFKLETFPRIRTTDDDGTVRFMSEKEIEGQLATAKLVADANC